MRLSLLPHCQHVAMEVMFQGGYLSGLDRSGKLLALLPQRSKILSRVGCPCLSQCAQTQVLIVEPDLKCRSNHASFHLLMKFLKSSVGLDVLSCFSCSILTQGVQPWWPCAGGRGPDLGLICCFPRPVSRELSRKQGGHSLLWVVTITTTPSRQDVGVYMINMCSFLYSYGL